MFTKNVIFKEKILPKQVTAFSKVLGIKVKWQKSKRLKETHDSFKKCPLNLWWMLKKTIMEIRNSTKAATFKIFLHLSYKNTLLSFLWIVLFQYFHETNIKRWFLGVTQKCELRVSFKYFTIFIPGWPVTSNCGLPRNKISEFFDSQYPIKLVLC